MTSSPQREPHTGSAAPGHDDDANDAPVLDRRAVLLAVGAAAALAACSAGEEELLGLPQPTFPPSAGGSGLDSEALGAVPGVPLPNIPFAEPRVPGGWGEVLGEYTESGPWQSAPAPQRSVPDEFNSRDGFAFPELSDEEIATAYADYKARVGLPAPPGGWDPTQLPGQPSVPPAPQPTATAQPTLTPAPPTGPTPSTPPPTLTPPTPTAVPEVTAGPTPAATNTPVPEPSATPVTPSTPPMQPPASVAAMLASRATFGATPAVVAAIESEGMTGWLDSQLAQGGPTDPSTDQLVVGYNTLTRTNQQNRQARSSSGNTLPFDERLQGELMHATLLRGVFSERQLYEVMVDFWNNHFTVYLINQGRYRHMVNQSDRTVARANALGYFSNMLMASAKDPAMLTFLDNATSDANSAAGINENYGREILELHSLGIVNGQQVYTEEDMRQVSLVLSGWSVDWQQDRDAFKFRPLWHHRGPVSILGGAWSRPDRTGASDAQLLADGENLVSFLAHHPSTARHLAFKMCRRFVADEPPMGLVDRMASIYLANGTAIAPMLRELFTSPEFAENTDTKLRRGFEVVMGYLRALNASIDTNPVGDTAIELHSLKWWQGVLERHGQRLFSKASPDGYSDIGTEWLGSDGVLRRWETAGLLTHNQLASGITVSLDELVPNPLPATMGDLIDAMMVRLTARLPGSLTKDALLHHLGATADAPAVAFPSAAVLADSVALMLTSPEFQNR